MRIHTLGGFCTLALAIAACSGDDASDDTTNSNPTDPTGATAGGDIAGIAGTEGIYLHEEYTTGVGGMLIVEYAPYLMFEDGTFYTNFATPPSQLDVATSKATEPKKWGTWKKSGLEVTLTWPDGDTDTWEDGQWFTTKAAAPNERIAGAYTSISGGGNTALGGDVMTFSSANIAFDGDKFTFESTGGGSTSNVTAYASQEKAGTYVLDGYKITLKFNSGKTEEKFFYFYPDSNDVFGIGDRYYVTDD